MNINDPLTKILVDVACEASEKPATTERPHHPYSPSKLQCIEGCPKFDQREGEVHEAAVIGTKQHDSVDTQLDDPTLPDYRAMAVAECIRLSEERVKLYPGGTVLREQYLPIDDEEIVIRHADGGGEVFKGTTAGYLDFGVVSADGLTAEILDWKFGQNAVEEAKNNLQGMAYGLGILKRFPKLQTIKVGFIMPHADYVSEHTFTRSEFDGMFLRVITVVRRAEEAHKVEDDYSMARPNLSSCRFCARIGRCPKVAEVVIAVGRKYAPLKIPADITPSLLLDPAQVKIGLGLSDIVKGWAEAYKRQSNAKAIQDPNFIPDGYTLVQQTKRSVVNAKKLGELAKEYLPEEVRPQVEDCYDIAIGSLEKLISTAAQRGEKEKTVEDFSLAALAVGALKEGEPFAYLRQSKKQDTGKTATS